MSDKSENESSGDRLPIFPLPLVLLPNEVLPLHIFEPRYKQMVADLRSTGNTFGINFIEAAYQIDTLDRPEIGSVGCSAYIRETETFPDGRSNILTAGLSRYRIQKYVDSGTPYLVAQVEYFSDDPEDEKKLSALADVVYELFERIAQAAFRMSGDRGQFPEVPRGDPEALSFLVSAAFGLDNRLKYELAAMTLASGRLERLKAILDQAVVQIEQSADIHRISRTNGHTKKPLDL